MSLRSSQIRTVVLLFCGYAACYYCRADLSVATPLLAGCVVAPVGPARGYVGVGVIAPAPVVVVHGYYGGYWHH